MNIIGMLIIVTVYMLLEVIFEIKKMDLAHRITSRVYWFVLGFWDIISSVYLNAGGVNRYVAIGCLFILIGIIYYISDLVKEYYKKV